MNILILGSSGLLGSSIYHSLRKISYLNVNHNGLKKRKYDLTKITDLKKLHVTLHVPFTDFHGLGRFIDFGKSLHVTLHGSFTDLHGSRSFEIDMFGSQLQDSTHEQ